MRLPELCAASWAAELMMGTRRMTTKEWLRLALEDAICWQEGLQHSYAHMPDDPEVKVIEEQLAAYRKILKRRYPPRSDPFKGAKLVNIYDIKETMKGASGARRRQDQPR